MFVANYYVVLVSFADNATFAATSLEELRLFWWMDAVTGALYLGFG